MALAKYLEVPANNLRLIKMEGEEVEMFRRPFLLENVSRYVCRHGFFDVNKGILRNQFVAQYLPTSAAYLHGDREERVPPSNET